VINRIFQRSTYLFAALAVLFIVTFAFAKRNESINPAVLNESIEPQQTHIAKLDTQVVTGKTINTIKYKNNIPASLIVELDQRIHAYPQDYEASLLKVLAYIEAGNLKIASILLNDLIRKSPGFKLAHLVKGDLLAMQVVPVRGVGRNDILSSFSTPELQTELNKLRDEVYIRLENYHQKFTQQRIPRSLLLMSKSVKVAVLIDKSKNRLYVFQRQSDLLPPKLVKDFYVSTGKLRGNKFSKGDLKTPEGVYFVTRWIPDGRLPDKYGIGAFPVNYPNELDIRLGKTGYGIWLHGTTSDSYSRPPLDSEGCVVLPNIDLNAIKHLVIPGKTPMIIAESIEWVDYTTWSKLRKDVLVSLEKWRSDWQSLNVDKYLNHYSDNFWSHGYNIRSWRARKKVVSRSKKYQKIKLDDISLFAYPDSATQENIVVARFHQSYQSNNYQSDMDKRLYLEKNKKGWKIIFEGK